MQGAGKVVTAKRVDGGIVATLLALGLICARAYLDSVRARLTLRVATEAWDVTTDLVADVLLIAAALIGLLTINPDIFADVKIAIPFCPLAFVLAGAAAVLRLFYGASRVATRPWLLATAMVGAAALLNWFGYTFVMEAAGHEWLASHPSPLWAALRALRSDLNPELAMATFLWTHPAMFAVFLWGVASAAIHTLRRYTHLARAADAGENP